MNICFALKALTRAVIVYYLVHSYPHTPVGSPPALHHYHWCSGASWCQASGWSLSLQIPPSSYSSFTSIWWPTGNPSLVIQVLCVPQLLQPNGGCRVALAWRPAYPAVPDASAALRSRAPLCCFAFSCLSSSSLVRIPFCGPSIQPFSS